MSILIFSDIRPVSRQILDVVPRTAPILIIDAAMPERNRGGGAAKLYAGAGLTVSVCDPLTEPLPDLSAYGAVHLSGGNPFRLLKAARGCGLQARLEAKLADPDFRLLAGSAGAMVLGTSIAHARALCPDLGVRDDSGFGWLNGAIMPHIDKGGQRYAILRTIVEAQPDQRWITVREKDFLNLAPDPDHIPMIG